MESIANQKSYQRITNTNSIPFNLGQRLMQTVIANNNSDYLHYAGLSISGSELYRKVLMLAQGLQCFVKSNERVLILLYDSPAFHICFLATLSIGAIPVPINPHLKEESFLYLLADSEAKAVIVESNLAESISTMIQHTEMNPLVFFQDLYTTHQKPLQFVDTHLLALSKLSRGYSDIANFQFVNKTESDIAFWQYTSGTTGRPKAVMHNGKGMLESYRLFAEQTLQLNADDKYYSAAKMFFGYGLGNSLFFPLLGGASTLLENRWSDINVVIENLNHFKPTVFFAMPTIYAQLIKQIDKIDTEVINKLKVCFSAGSPLPKSIFEQWLSCTGLDIYDGIGATEIGHVFICNSKQAVKAGSTGKPVQGYEIKIIDKRGFEVEHNAIGVLLVKGPSLSDGYWKQPEITQTKFIGDWYRTGDLFSRDSENYFYYHGREDDLFKVKGRWVEPFEVEGLLLKHFKHIISETKLVGIENNDGLIEANLFVICNKDDGFDKDQLSEDILTLLISHLESYKLPTYIHYVSAFLRNENGKVVNELLRQLVA